MLRRSTQVLIAAILTGWLTGCAATGGDGPRTVNGVQAMDEKGRAEEYRALADTYPWPLPDGLSFPEVLPTAVEPTMYEVGEGANQADSYWICAWMTDWLATQDTAPAAAKVAWAWVERADETQLHTEHYYDPRDIWHKEILEPAARGRIKSFREFQATSCSYPELTQRLKVARPASGKQLLAGHR